MRMSSSITIPRFLEAAFLKTTFQHAQTATSIQKILHFSEEFRKTENSGINSLIAEQVKRRGVNKCQLVLMSHSSVSSPMRFRGLTG